MLALTGQEHFYFIPGCTDMRYGYRKLAEIVRHKFLRNPLNGDVYIFMNYTRTTVRMFQFENHAFYVHEKHFIDGYRFMNIQTDDDGKTYHIDWEDLLAVLETPIVKTIKLQQTANANEKKKH